MDIDKINTELRSKSPEEIVNWALLQAKKPIVTTNFRPYAGAILHLVSCMYSSIDVIWCDTGYNTPNTYRHAEDLIERFGLNMDIYLPKQTKAYRDVVLGIPNLDDPKHKLFTEQVKLEPFKRALKHHKPDVWFTNLRKGQTAFRDTIDILSLGKDGILKVSPFYYWSDEDLDIYLEENKIPNEFKYFDPTKQLENRECGLHA